MNKFYLFFSDGHTSEKYPIQGEYIKDHYIIIEAIDYDNAIAFVEYTFAQNYSRLLSEKDFTDELKASCINDLLDTLTA